MENENKIRADNHLRPVVMDDKLNKVAEQLVQQFAKKHKYEHTKRLPYSYAMDVQVWYGLTTVSIVTNWMKTNYVVS